MADNKPKQRKSKKPTSRAAKKTRVPAKKKTPVKKTAARSAAKTLSGKVGARKSVPIKTARVSKRALLPRLPPPVASSQAKRSAARVPSRAKVLGRARAVRSSKAVFNIPACTELALREKLRLAAPYLQLWLARASAPANEADSLTPEAAFVRIWQWLMLEAVLEGSHVVITPDLVQKLFAEEMGRGPAA